MNDLTVPVSTARRRARKAGIPPARAGRKPLGSAKRVAIPVTLPPALAGMIRDEAARLSVSQAALVEVALLAAIEAGTLPRPRGDGSEADAPPPARG